MEPERASRRRGISGCAVVAVLVMGGALVLCLALVPLALTTNYPRSDPSVGRARTLRSDPACPQMALLGRTYLDRLEEAKAKDDRVAWLRALGRAYDDGQAIPASPSNGLKVAAVVGSAVEVEILDGPQRGKKGWIAARCLEEE